MHSSCEEHFPITVQPLTLVLLQVNDYFDYQLGIDAHKMYKPLVGGTVPIAVAKRFLYFLYSALLLCLPFVPGVPARISVVVGVMLSYQYTRHLKPITWLKNIVCASLIALSPATSGAAAYSLSSNKSWSLLFGVPALWRLVGMNFLGFVGREILMDINDMEDDLAHDVRTVPVAFGRKFAAKVALSCTAAMTVAATMGPVWQIRQAVGSSLTWTTLLSTLRTSPATRKLMLASIGSLAMMRRAWQVYKTEGEDRDIVERAIEEGKLSVMFLLASFV
jgi:4-hydroxybenzoate polyprenyltransferase